MLYRIERIRINYYQTIRQQLVVYNLTVRMQNQAAGFFFFYITLIYFTLLYNNNTMYVLFFLSLYIRVINVHILILNKNSHFIVLCLTSHFHTNNLSPIIVSNKISNNSSSTISIFSKKKKTLKII